MQWLKLIGNAIRIIVVYFLFVLAIWLLVYILAKFSPTAALWAIASLAALEAVAVVVLVGFAVLYVISLIFGSVERVIQRMWPSRLYEQPENIFKLTAHVVVLLGITLVVLLPLATCPGGLGCSDWGAEGALAAETETMQTAMNAMMVDRKITTVTPNDDTTGSLGVNTWNSMPAGPDAASLDGYLIKATTYFYYCWDSKGNVSAQNKKDGVKAEPKDAEEQRPCKRSP